MYSTEEAICYKQDNERMFIAKEMIVEVKIQYRAWQDLKLKGDTTTGRVLRVDVDGIQLDISQPLQHHLITIQTGQLLSIKEVKPDVNV